jgi:sugar O-acyltransferase (sialic acid O-acetyltransferase NeuD family)
MRPLVIFGAGEYAKVACSYFREAETHDVVGFSIDREYIDTGHYHGLPLVPFEDLSRLYPPSTHDLFVAIGYAQVNAVRRAKYHAAKAMGYQMASYISPRATVHSDAELGEHCFILDNAVVEPFATIGQNVTIWTGAVVAHYSQIGSHSFLSIGSIVAAGTSIGEQCYLGAGSIVHDHLRIGDRTVVGAGCAILADMGTNNI